MKFEYQQLNSMTKYPSILTYHEFEDRGRLKEELVEGKFFKPEEDVQVYEKVDGENSRIILVNPYDKIELYQEKAADYFIGSREEILGAKGDRIYNPKGNIAEFLEPIAESLQSIFQTYPQYKIITVYQESYGTRSTAAWKNYTKTGAQGYKVFDIVGITHEEYSDLKSKDTEKIASWRDNGGQYFFNEEEKRFFINHYSLEAAPLLAEIKGDELPKKLEPTYEFLKQFSTTKVGLDFNGQSEGIIIRNGDRSLIRKIRFESYRKTFK